MNISRTTTSYILLWITAIIWGFAFVAQRKGMEFIGPFTYNGIRFTLGTLSLIPFLYLSKSQNRKYPSKKFKVSLTSGALIAGLALFLGASLQQIGIIYTTAGNAGFITSLYVVITPLLGLAFKQFPGKQLWVGVVVATLGLYFLSITEKFSMNMGDVFVLASAFFFASHVLIISWLSPKYNVIKIAILQFAMTSVLSLLVAIFTEEILLESILRAAVPILYGGLASVGVAYTLQAVAQQHAKAAVAAIILSFEAFFGAVGGWLFLHETFSGREMFGCFLMLCGIIIAQLRFEKKKKESP